MDDRLFVYGSLMRGCQSHYKLEGARFLCEARTAPVFRMFDGGPFPFLVEDERTGTWIEGEVYAVTPELLRALDEFEGVPDLYVRERTVLAGPLPRWSGSGIDFTQPVWIYTTSQKAVIALGVRSLPEVGKRWRK